jgi:hypothetical protein
VVRNNERDIDKETAKRWQRRIEAQHRANRAEQREAARKKAIEEVINKKKDPERNNPL